MGYHDLVLDRQVLVWVLIPLTMSIMLMMLLRQYAHQLMSSEAPPKTSAKEIGEAQAVSRAHKLREQAGWIPPQAFRMRRAYFIAKDTGVFHQKAESKSMQEAMATDPSMMVDMLKKNLTGLIPQIVMGAWVNYFFAGFVLGKVPFSLSPRFRPMLQRGIDMSSLDVSYFTSLSYYILLLFGLRGVFSLFFREETIDDTELMRRQMNPMSAMNPGFDAQKAFDAERENLEVYDHTWKLQGVEERACKALQKFLDTPLN
ncbi:unnamed protein product [Ostreobium quekettii]|uniref:ER membrane protein complex subunit 3 n=1 Tax=Ostreobium quekettii TaxID=121088 RepID=A0A8S1IUH3_9CHLO|nr:unnamed protein product [Ostreobium quekettii]|eukprot:evm.model.scf_76.1 EVM.evm.TU.scf_76.1   scf_76:3170-5393(-)